jgi:hypothetical protein
MRKPMRALPVFIVFLFAVPAVSAQAAGGTTAPYFLKYSVSDRVVTVVSAVTPYDPNPRARDAFLHWFKRGLETLFAGTPSLMITWDITPEGKAGREGYDFGMDEAERYLKKEKNPSRSLQTAPIPLGR